MGLVPTQQGCLPAGGAGQAKATIMRHESPDFEGNKTYLEPPVCPFLKYGDEMQESLVNC